ncbi:MAG: type II secretion system protein [Quinella sp. 3Q1]|nr:type II secretion system protein [Quinella sp. 3Q1]
MQKGFATLEIILFTLIIAVLATATLPNAARVIDRVALDYETKKLYTDLRFLQSLERMTNMESGHFTGDTINEIDRMIIYPNYYTLEKTANNKIYYEHYFSSGVTASEKSKTEPTWVVKFDEAGRISPSISDSLKLTSRFNKISYIVFDSVGRFRGGRGQ